MPQPIDGKWQVIPPSKTGRESSQNCYTAELTLEKFFYKWKHIHHLSQYFLFYQFEELKTMPFPFFFHQLFCSRFVQRNLWWLITFHITLSKDKKGSARGAWFNYIAQHRDLNSTSLTSYFKYIYLSVLFLECTTYWYVCIQIKIKNTCFNGP